MTAGVILAAGHGTRMQSRRAKVLHELGGVPLVQHVLSAAAAAHLDPIVVVVGYQAEAVARVVGQQARLVNQPRALGTGDAVHRALSVLPVGVDRVVVLYGDTPLVPPSLVESLALADVRYDAVLVTAAMSNPAGYGRVVRGADGELARIVEDHEADDAERAITEINTGLGVWRRTALLEVLPMLEPHGDERYLPDAIPLVLARGGKLGTIMADDPTRVMGINTRQGLAEAEAILRRDTLSRLMDGGVTIIDPASTYIDAGVRVGMDTVIGPMTSLRGRTVVGEGVRLGPSAVLVDAVVGDHAVIGASVVEQSHVGPHSEIGPWCHLRSGTYLERDVHLGNFVELKNARLGLGTKAGHHAYLGDVTIGAHVNIGAGTVIVNYDGRDKHQTYIGDHAFIGCNANLVAPLEVGAGAYVAAGSTVDHHVPPDALAIARARQETKPEWARKRREAPRS